MRLFVEDKDEAVEQQREVGDDGDGSDVAMRRSRRLHQPYVGERRVDAGRQLDAARRRRPVQSGGDPVHDVQVAQDAVETVLGVVLDHRQGVFERSRLVARLLEAQKVNEHGHSGQLQRRVGHRRRQLYSRRSSNYQLSLDIGVNVRKTRLRHWHTCSYWLVDQQS